MDSIIEWLLGVLVIVMLCSGIPLVAVLFFCLLKELIG